MTASTLIAVDIGNFSTKVGWGFDLHLLAMPMPNETRSFNTGQTPDGEFLKALPRGSCHWRIASVHREGTRLLLDWLATHRSDDERRVLEHHDLPIPVNVLAPERVGLDRLAAAVAAKAGRRSGHPAIVIDAGSAITVDLVSADGAFEGGVILPGFRMSAEALCRADLLPLVAFSPNREPPAIVGKDTEGAIRSGLFWGAVGAVREAMARMSAQVKPEPDIFVTGGDLQILSEHLGTYACFFPDMVLSGIAVADMLR